jgi:hypothetical protein
MHLCVDNCVFFPMAFLKSNAAGPRSEATGASFSGLNVCCQLCFFLTVFLQSYAAGPRSEATRAFLKVMQHLLLLRAVLSARQFTLSHADCFHSLTGRGAGDLPGPRHLLEEESQAEREAHTARSECVLSIVFFPDCVLEE